MIYIYTHTYILQNYSVCFTYILTTFLVFLCLSALPFKMHSYFIIFSVPEFSRCSETLFNFLKIACFPPSLFTLGRTLISSILTREQTRIVFLAFPIRLLNTKHPCCAPSAVLVSFPLFLAKQKETRIMQQHEVSGLNENSVIVFFQSPLSLADSF